MALKLAITRDDLVLVPNTGVQFVTYPFDVNDLDRFDRKFIERPHESGKTTDEGEPLDSWRLLQGWNDDNPKEAAEHQPGERDNSYSISNERALEPFLNKWVPVPYLRIHKAMAGTRREKYDDGPTNWVRVRVVEAASRAEPGAPSHIAVFAFDTSVDEDIPLAEEEASTRPYVPYTEPRVSDVENPRTFGFVSEMAKLDRFLSDLQLDPGTGDETDYQRWVVNWLEKLFIELKEFSVAPRRLKPGDFPHHLEHAARWIGLLDLLARVVVPAKVRFADTLSARPRFQPVNVDLILDVGNSRTCGILIEDLHNQDRLGIDGCKTLELRDLSEPEKVYSEPFESHVEFAQAWFGPDDLSRDSGRQRAFFWPSLVRVGPEATRLRNQGGGTESLCGMSSPKRYLWDVAASNQAWRFPASDYVDGTMPPIGLKIRQYLNSNGDVLTQVRKESKLFQTLHPTQSVGGLTKWSAQLTCSRSSVYTFMLAEVIWQAFVMINNPEMRAKRSQSEVPRRLNRIIITLPTAVPTREQRIMRARAQSAVNLLWDVMGWTANQPRGTTPPVVQVSWDEASCVQLVWLYGEVVKKFGGNIDGYFSLKGKPRLPFTADGPPRPDARPANSLRVASIDVGGGTTDLMITTYFHHDNMAIDPVQTFRESFRIAGDDVTLAVIERAVIPAFTAYLASRGVRQAREILRHLFGGNWANITVQETSLRRQFVLQVFLPVALKLMAAYEAAPRHEYRTVAVKTLGELVPEVQAVPAETRAYLTQAFAQHGLQDLALEEIPIALDFNALRLAVQETLRNVLDNLAEAIHHFDCDMVLMSGRPSKLPAVMEMVVDRLPVTPDRILAMHEYRPGTWYPFKAGDGMRIGDPKTATVVGGMLCALSERQLPNFMVYTKNLQMRTTAKYIGYLEGNNKLKDESVLFTATDEAVRSRTRTNPTLRYYSEMALGFRQLPFERWIASPLYRLHEDKRGKELSKPVLVTLARAEFVDEDNPDQLLERESAKEELRIEEASDNQQANVASAMFLTLRTMDSAGSYWLDSGVVTV
ncbi:hypothetical protein FHS55_003556 [Angulomicrobium tetraedrale]|uniref:Virulence factor SrfB n=1 Tax=Ancylobacter tetraedralis TaxID=217068 RepID=A0A839ZDR0_9HYPH|nr:virulence factor SrfB [Ancylobacter tetraedralis]MBB3772931.1 hypothetical protein [Ancylobacter tetraedralis]